MDRLLPVNEKNGRGTGIGTLMPTCVSQGVVDSYEWQYGAMNTWPASVWAVYLRATAPEFVKMAVPLPQSLALTRAMAYFVEQL